MELKKKGSKRVLSATLSVAMAFTTVSGMTLTASAATECQKYYCEHVATKIAGGWVAEGHEMLWHTLD